MSFKDILRKRIVDEQYNDTNDAEKKLLHVYALLIYHGLDNREDIKEIFELIEDHFTDNEEFRLRLERFSKLSD